MISALINNSRQIINGWIRKANKYKYNESLNQMVEDASGEPNDRTAADTGEEPIHMDYSHIKDSGSTEPY